MPTKTDLAQARAEVTALVETPAAIERLTATLTQIGAQVERLDTAKVEEQSAHLSDLVAALQASGERINDALAELRDLREADERRRRLLTWLPLAATAVAVIGGGALGMALLGRLEAVERATERTEAWAYRATQHLEEAARKAEAKPEPKPDPKPEPRKR